MDTHQDTHIVALERSDDVVRVHPPIYAGLRLYCLPVDITFDPIEAQVLHQVGLAQVGHIHAVSEFLCVWGQGPVVGAR